MSKVSVLMPVYNTKEEYLREAIESILNQTFTDFEFIILNDSPENLKLDEIVKSYNDNRIKYYKNDVNLGISESRNKLLSLAEGQYVAVADHDDISLPERLKLENDYLDNNPDVGVVSCNFQWILSGKVSNYPLKNIDIKKELLKDNVILHTGMMIRKSVLDAANVKYEPLYSPAEDYMLCIRLMNCTMFSNLPEVLVRYRNNYDNTSYKHSEKMLDAYYRCNCVAAQNSAFRFISNTFWVYIFKYIPLLKIKKDFQDTRVYLFGLIPIFSYLRRKNIRRNF